MSSLPQAALYIRVSTEEQAAEGQSVSAQTEILKQYCSLYNIEIFKIYMDLGISGKEAHNRPGLLSMLQDAREGKFNLVIVWKISRLSRNLKDLLLIIDELEKSGVTFTSYSEKFDTSTAVGKMTLQLLGSIAEFERNTIIDNVKLGLQEYARKGGKTGTVLGYDNIDKRLVINSDEADVVKRIYNLYVFNKMSMADIAAHLNNIGCETKRNNSFTKDSIAVILSNPVYIGINRHNIGSNEEYVTNGTHEPIISAEIWEAAQRLKESNKRKKRQISYESDFLLSGKIMCHCGSNSMYGSTSKAAAKKYRYYRCKSCGFICNADKIEGAVLNKIKELLNSADIVESLNNKTSQTMKLTQDSLNAELLQREFNRTQRLLDKYVSLQSNEDFKSSLIVIGKIKELEQKIIQLHINKKELENTINQLKIQAFTKEDYMKILENADTEKVRNIIDAIIESVSLNPYKGIEYFKLNP